MKRIFLIPALIATMANAPAQAETDSTIGRFFDLLEKFSTDSEDIMQQFLDEMGPALTELLDTISDWSNYAAPEVLPNGDIIIRRKPDAALEKPLPEGTKEI
jgi:hypothetical protein